MLPPVRIRIRISSGLGSAALSLGFEASGKQQGTRQVIYRTTTSGILPLATVPLAESNV